MNFTYGTSRRRAAARGAVLAALIALVLAGVAPTSAPAKQRANLSRGHAVKGHLSKRSAYWGAWIGTQANGEKPPWDMRPVAQLGELLGKKPSLVPLGSPFADCDPAPCRFFDFPASAMDNALAYGAIPFFDWSSQEASPTPSLTTQMPNYQLSDVLSGRYDSYIREFAEDARDWGHPFFLRFNWEMNGDWFPWAERVNGNRPGEYVAVWRHVHDIFAAAGAANATWVWCPYSQFKRHLAPLAPLYPGGDYVDWTCIDGFNWGANPTNPHRWRSFASIFSTTYRQLVRRIAPEKPIVIAEVASTGPGRAKAIWIRKMFRDLKHRYRRVRALIWFNQVDRDIGWPLETSARTLRAFARGIRRPSFQAGGQMPVVNPIGPPG